LSESVVRNADVAGESSPVFRALQGNPELQSDLSEVAKAIDAAGGCGASRPAPRSCGHRPSASPSGRGGLHSGRPGWLGSMGLTRVDLAEMVPIQGHVPSAFLVWWRLEQKKLAEQLDLMRRCSFDEAIR